MPSALPHIKADKLRALGVASAAPLPALPEVPTIAAAAGLPGFEAVSWYALMAPAGTPREVIDRVQKDSAKILLSDDFRAKLALQGMVPVANTPAEFAAAIRDESARWAKVIKERNLSAN